MRERSVFKMADDFDKEAPDVMENQIITENPLEFSVIVIKKEVLNFYDSEFESTTSSVQDRKPYLQEEIVPNSFDALSSEIPDSDIYQDDLLNSNKIIFGSKSNLVSDDEDHCEYSDKLYPENELSFAKDPKLHPDSIDENYFEELVTSYEPKVELLDIQSYLHKSRRYCATCGILFPELNAFEKHVRIYHKASDLNKRRIYKCTICDKKFVTPQVLRNHRSNIHKLNNGKILQRSKYRRVLDKTTQQHRCTICAKNFVAPHVLRTHLINIHKINYGGVPREIIQNTENNTTKELDSQIVNHEQTLGWSNTCFHCKKTFDTQKCLIEHLYDILQMKRKNTEIVPVLKSILFKCNKCDINFTSSQFAANHAEHMEMLINWKCTICNRIFKKEDALSHERQHSVSNNFLVYNLGDLDVTRILYKCSKCAVHFTESNFLYHFRDCGLEVSKPIHCRICNMSLDYNIITSHESENHTEPNYYTIIESDVISDNPVKLTANKYQEKDKLQELNESLCEAKVVLQRIDSNKVNKSNSVKWSSDQSLSDLESSTYEQTSNSPQKLQKDTNASGFCSTVETTVRNQKKIDLRPKNHLTYYYCETCKCFVSRLKKKNHLEARCKEKSKGTCKRCGLTFTTASLMTHRRLHKERKDLTLKSFKFFNLYNGQPINPAKPEFVNTKQPIKTQLGRRNMTYYYCETCKCFLTKFNKAVFHKRKLCKKIAKANCKHCGLLFTSASIMTHRRLHEEMKDLTVKNFKLFNLYNGQPMDPPVLAPEIISLQQPVNNETEIGHIKRPAHNGDRSTKKVVKYYFCETCKCSVTNHKKNVHLEARCKDLTKSTCKYCGLTFTKASMITHMRLHKERKGLSLKSFKFFNLYNGLRMSPPIREVINLNEHVKTLSDLESSSYEQTSNTPQELQKDNKAYGYCSATETTVRHQKKLDLRQNRNLTYYYCETCKCFVSKIKSNIHLEARCKKFRKETCKLCGLTFTTASLVTHNRLHEEKKDLSLNNFKFANLYNGLPMNLPVPGNAIIKGTVKNAAELKKKKRSAKSIKNWQTRRNLTYYYCETCKCSVTKFRKEVHLEARCSKLTKTTCKLCGLMFTKQSMITHTRLHEEKKDISLKNFKFFNLYNGQPINIPVLEVAKTPLHSEAEVVKRPINVEAKDECLLEPVSDNDDFDNVNRPVNIEGEYICSNPPINNEADVESIKRLLNNESQSGNLKPPINIIPDVESIILPENNDDMVINTKCRSNIQAAVENIIGLVYNEAEVEGVKQTINISMNLPVPGNAIIKGTVKNAAEVKKNKRSAKSIKNWQTRRNLTYYYCETCKCSVTKFRKDVHLEARCSKLTKTTCKLCGLMFTKQSMITHTRLHEEKKDISLKNFKFFNLYNGQPIDIPVLEVAKTPIHSEAEVVKRPINVEAKDECLLQPVSDKNDFDNVNRPVNVEGEYTSSNPPINNEADVENIKRLLNNEAQSGNLKSPINIIPDEESIILPENNDDMLKNTKCLSNIQAAVENIIGLVYNKAEVEGVKQTINIESEVLNTKYPSNIQTDIEYINLIVNNEVEVVNTPIHSDAEVVKRPINVEAKDECLLQPVSDKDDFDNVNRPVNIEREYIYSNPPINNEAQSGNLIPPINIIPDVESIILPENNDAMVINTKCLSNIQAAVDNIIGLVYNKAEGEGVKQTINIESEVLNTKYPSNIQTDIENIKRIVNNEVEVENLKRSINIGTAVENLIRPINNNSEVDNFENPIINEAEDTNIELPVNSESLSNNKALDESKYRHVDNEDENIARPVNLGTTLINRPVTYEEDNDMSTKFSQKYYFCETCKCFVTHFRKNTHLRARCKKLAKMTCKHCGLTFTNGSMLTHRRLHEKKEDLTLNNFKFFNLYNGQRMNPPIQEVVGIEQSEDLEVVNITKPSHNETEALHLKLPGNDKDWRTKINMTLYYCETCECFVTKYKKVFHLQARCKNFTKVTCERCGLTITSNSIMTHIRLHEEMKEFTLNNFKIFNLNNGQPMNSHTLEVLIKKRNVNIKAEVSSIKPAGKEGKIINLKRSLNIKAKRPRRNLSYYFCETCKCFVTKFTKNAHLQARCKSFSKIICKLCGLRFTKASMMTHKRLHKENKDLSVKNFKFFYLNNGQPMNAPVSEAVNRNRLVDKLNLSNYYCETCKCFETEMGKGGHIHENCINMAKLPCKYCGLIFSSASFVLHKSLHEERKNLTLNNFTFFDLQNGKHINPPLPEYPKCISCAVHFLTITAKNSHICSEVSSLTCHICEIKLSEAAFKLHMTFHQFITDNTKMIESNNVQSASSAITISLDQIDIDHHGTLKNVTNTSNDESHETELHNSVGVAEASLLSTPGSIVYICRNCSVSVDTYDKAVEHSQRHYEPGEHVTQTIVCELCNLNIDEACYIEHQNVHENGSQFKLLYFDSYYLPADNNLWVKHIFQTLPNEKIVEILRNSIYRFECRIKMDVIQQGDPNLTVYKCDQCGCFIEPSSLFKHSDNACFKLRNHPCTLCGIPFNSSASRIDHEQIHNRPNLTMESYRIVVFNRERDLQINRSFCLRKNYVLYKCRNCDVIIDKLREDVHKCDFTNVKECPDCALLMNMTDYESHVNMHKEFISFNYSNMKVILLGEANTLEVTSENISKLKFKGAIYDYKMFVCNKCEICIRNEEFMLKHICRFGKQRSKCLKCGLYLSVGRLKTHTRCHEQDPDFLRSNMYIIAFDPCIFDKNKNDTKLYSKDKDSELSESDTDSDSEILRANYTSTGDDANTVGLTTEHIEEETAKLYKCTCELHFLNEDGISRHFGACRANSNIPKLKCQKCDLLFTPNVLFTHLLAHHNNNGRRYKYDIVEFDSNQGNMIQ
ncbi:uncharacterized protein LOC134804322 [Cydia splendana]|uniref:uncharacterized protein LOC134804322 n=1 Tax=Cydia splendana TaxID=1100963 RepID=UPI00300CE3FD